MKRILTIAALAVCLFSCRTHKTVMASDIIATTAYVDTTRTAADSIGYKATASDTTKTTAAFEGNNVIEFVDGGGTVSIDLDGNVTLEGVKNIKSRQSGKMIRENGIELQSEETIIHHEQLNGVEAENHQKQKLTEERVPARKWYETVLIRLSLAVCLAALLWILFLYLKRKR